MIIILLALLAFNEAQGESRYVDTGMAREYCDSVEIEPLEGIWEFPEDETEVLIKRMEGVRGEYEIVLLATPDCRARPGEIIGTLKATAESRNYKLRLYSMRKDKLLTDTRECLATLGGKEDVILIHPVKLRISMRSMTFLPKFWRMLRVSVDNPLDKLKRGLVKRYPSYDGNQSEGEIRWL